MKKITSVLPFFGLLICSQMSTSQSTYYKAFDSIVGFTQSSLYNGTRYVEAYLSTPDNHHFFDTPQFINSDIVYDGQPYFDIRLKYDLIRDVLVINLKGDKSFLSLQLISEKVEKFTLNNRTFYNLSSHQNLNTLGFTGFFELAYSGVDLNLHIKHLKTRKERYKGNKVVYLFDQSYYYLVDFKNTYHLISSKNDWKKIFPDKSQEINTFYKDYQSMEKNNPTEFMKRLASVLDRK